LPALAVTESIRKWRGPFRTTAASPSSRASAPASKASHQGAGQLFSPIVFQMTAVPFGGALFSSMISQ
jgi:hypothetical protein